MNDALWVSFCFIGVFLVGYIFGYLCGIRDGWKKCSFFYRQALGLTSNIEKFEKANPGLGSPVVDKENLLKGFRK